MCRGCRTSDITNYRGEYDECQRERNQEGFKQRLKVLA